MDRRERGMLRLWLVLSAGWAGLILYLHQLSAVPSVIPALIIPPLIVLAIGAGIMWSMRGFQR